MTGWPHMAVAGLSLGGGVKENIIPIGLAAKSSATAPRRGVKTRWNGCFSDTIEERGGGDCNRS